MSLSLSLIFWYGVLHAFGPDHLTAIADFSIGANRRKTLMISILFAIGHGISLFLFAKLLEQIPLSETLLGYGDMISAAVIIGMGLYLLYLVATDRIRIGAHTHPNHQHHLHIWHEGKHDHTKAAERSTLSMGLLMGAGGVRGMLVTLGAVGSGEVTWAMVMAFTLGAMVVFVTFGVAMIVFNRYLNHHPQHLRGAFALAGVISLAVGLHVLVA